MIEFSLSWRKEANASNVSIENNLKIGKKTTYPKVTFDSEDSFFKDSSNSANNLYQFHNEIDERYAKALTTRGLKEEDIREVADIIADVIENREDSAVIEAAKAKVQAICKK